MDGVSYPYKLFLDPPLGFVIKLVGSPVGKEPRR